jgi:hypothetical protein
MTLPVPATRDDASRGRCRSLTRRATIVYLAPMHRTWWSRTFSAVIAVWLAFSLTEPAVGHACPVHSVGSGAHSPAHASDAAAHHAGLHAAAAPAEQGSHNAKRCTCLGHCCSISPVGFAAPPVELTMLGAPALRDSGLPPYEYVAVAAEHILPFQNGPPAVL